MQEKTAPRALRWDNTAILSLYVRFSTLKNVKIDEHVMRSAFQQFGRVTAVTIKSKTLNRETMCFRGYAFVHYEVSPNGRASALAALANLHNSVYLGVHYRVETSRNFAQVEALCLSNVWGQPQAAAGAMLRGVPVEWPQQVYYQQALGAAYFPAGNGGYYYGNSYDSYNVMGVHADGNGMLYTGGDTWYQVCDSSDVPAVYAAPIQAGYVPTQYSHGGLSPEDWPSTSTGPMSRLGPTGVAPGISPHHAEQPFHARRQDRDFKKTQKPSQHLDEKESLQRPDGEEKNGETRGRQLPGDDDQRMTEADHDRSTGDALTST